MAAYGWPPGHPPLDYTTYVALTLNVERVRTRAAAVVARGYVAALDPADLDRGWADAEALDAAEVDEIAFQTSKVRAEVRRRQRPPGAGGFPS